MPAYLVQAAKGHTRINQTDAMVVFAADAPDARAVANAYYTNDPTGAFDGATVTEIVAGTDLPGLELSVKILDSTPPVSIVAPSTGLSVFSGAIGAAGSGYADNEVVTLGGGTAVRAATLRVVSQNAGAVTAIEVIDPGEYSVLPTGAQATTASASGTGLTITATGGTGRVENCAAAAVGLLNAQSIIAAASVDFGDSGGPLLTIADGSTDALGDRAVEVVARVNGASVPSLVSTITSEGLDSADLSVLLPAAASYPAVTAPVKMS